MMKYQNTIYNAPNKNQKTKCSLSIIIPCYNEQKIILKSISKIRKLKKTFPDLEIIVCEDGSTDGTCSTLRLLEDLCPELTWLHSEKKIGKGGAIMQGINQAHGEIVCFMDADLSADINHIDEFYEQIINGYDLIIGRRNSHIKRSAKRRISSYMFNLLVRLFFNTKINDHQCGFKVMRRSSIIGLLPLKNLDFIFDAELIIRAKQYGLKIKEIPVRWKETSERESKVHVIHDGYVMGKSLLKLKFL